MPLSLSLPLRPAPLASSHSHLVGPWVGRGKGLRILGECLSLLTAWFPLGPCRSGGVEAPAATGIGRPGQLHSSLEAPVTSGKLLTLLELSLSFPTYKVELVSPILNC
jgi:hypothetical protein